MKPAKIFSDLIVLSRDFGYLTVDTANELLEE